ncbi:hypothetical protein [Halocatena halophila]|uniref:hypothetical protein n=1 Tax=Halocatena halophila TaxID=2814576 RepID=UPI002ED1498B
MAHSSSDPTPVGIKIGSTRTVVATPDGRSIDTDTTLTCLAEYEDVLSGEQHAIFGQQAVDEYPERVEFMLRTGLPEDERRTKETARFFERIVTANDLPANSVVVYAIPAVNNEAGIDNLGNVIESTPVGDRLIRGYPESLCGSIPAFGRQLAAIGRVFISINLGSTNIGACAYQRGEQLVRFTTGSIAGNEVDRWIANNIEEETQGRVNVDESTAREYKENHGALDDFEPFTDVIQQPGGGTHEFTINRSVVDGINRYVDKAVETIADEFLPQLANDHMKIYKHSLEEPIVLNGGMASIPDLVEAFERRLGKKLQHDIDVIAPETPETAAARGALQIAEQFIDQDWYYSVDEQTP